jgi:hypothetical protein
MCVFAGAAGTQNNAKVQCKLETTVGLSVCEFVRAKISLWGTAATCNTPLTDPLFIERCTFSVYRDGVKGSVSSGVYMTALNGQRNYAKNASS